MSSKANLIKQIGRKIKIQLGCPDFLNQSFISFDGHAIYGVNSIEITASIENQLPKVTIVLHPELIEIEGVSEVEAFLDIKKDRFENLDTD